MGLPGNFMGNAGRPEFAGEKALVDKFIDFVESEARRRKVPRGAFPILRPANFFLLLDVYSVHVVYTNQSAGGLPHVMIHDLASEQPEFAVHNVAAAQAVQDELGWTGCEAVSLPRVLVKVDDARRDEAIRTIASHYCDSALSERERALADQDARMLMNISPPVSSTLMEGIKAAVADVPLESAVFVMMRYQDSETYAAIERIVADVLRDYGLQARLAKDKAYSEDLWENVRVYLHACEFGLAIFEEIDFRSFNPSVSIELGYMYALGRRVLLLREQRMAAMPTDIVGKIYRPFDSYRIDETIRKQVAAWLEHDLGKTKLVTEPVCKRLGLSAGDLIKAAGDEVDIVASGCQRRCIPNVNTLNEIMHRHGRPLLQISSAEFQAISKGADIPDLHADAVGFERALREIYGGFDRDGFRLPSTGYQKTRFGLEGAIAGVEARAVLGSTAKGDALLVCLQDIEISEAGLDVWLTVENRGDRSYRWFGCNLTCYASPSNVELQPSAHESGGHMICDVYPGDQFTVYYFFPFSNEIRGPKFLTCKSHDKDLTFWWARGA